MRTVLPHRPAMDINGWQSLKGRAFVNQAIIPVIIFIGKVICNFNENLYIETTLISVS